MCIFQEVTPKLNHSSTYPVFYGDLSNTLNISHFEWFYNKKYAIVRLQMAWKAENLIQIIFMGQNGLARVG